MRHALILATILWIAASRAEEPLPPADPTLAPLIAKLGDENFDIREATEKEILARAIDHEESFAPVLKELIATEHDAEVRIRLEKLVKKLSAFGSVDWSVEAGQIFQLPAIYNKRVYIGNKDGYLMCYDQLSGHVLWKHENGGFMYKSVAVSDGRVIFIRTRKDGRPDGRVFALDAIDGHELWSWQDDKKSQNFTPPIVADGSIYFGREHELICLDALQGERRWHLRTPEAVATPSVAPGRVIYEQARTLECVDAEDAQLIWAFPLEGAKAKEAEAPISLTGTAFDQAESISVPNAYFHAGVGACIDAGRVFAADGNTVYRINLKTGEKIWESHGPDDVKVSLAVKGNRVYAAHSMTLRCLNATDGTEIWSKETGGDIYAAPAVVGDRVYVGSLNNKLTMYCLEAATGKEVWSHFTQEGGYAEPIVVGRRLFMGYHSKFYCLKTGMPGPAAWPMSGGNPGRSGCND